MAGRMMVVCVGLWAKLGRSLYVDTVFYSPTLIEQINSFRRGWVVHTRTAGQRCTY